MSTYSPTSINDRIRDRLIALRLSQRAASEAAGLNLGYVADLFSGKSAAPTGAKLDRLAVALQCSPAWLATGQGASELNPAYAYVVTGSRGEYSDRKEWPARVVAVEADAQALVQRMTQEATVCLAGLAAGHEAWTENRVDFATYERVAKAAKACMADTVIEIDLYCIGSSEVRYTYHRIPVGMPGDAR